LQRDLSLGRPTRLFFYPSVRSCAQPVSGGAITYNTLEVFRALNANTQLVNKGSIKSGLLGEAVERGPVSLHIKHSTGGHAIWSRRSIGPRGRTQQLFPYSTSFLKTLRCAVCVRVCLRPIGECVNSCSSPPVEWPTAAPPELASLYAPIVAATMIHDAVWAREHSTLQSAEETAPNGALRREALRLLGHCAAVAAPGPDDEFVAGTAARSASESPPSLQAAMVTLLRWWTSTPNQDCIQGRCRTFSSCYQNCGYLRQVELSMFFGAPWHCKYFRGGRRYRVDGATQWNAWRG